MVWHQGLIYKLKVCGLHRKIRQILKGFLSARVQRVVLNCQCSNRDVISTGVSQGSVLGPLLFLIDINNITHNVKFCNKLFPGDLT